MYCLRMFKPNPIEIGGVGEDIDEERGGARGYSLSKCSNG
jgi:hypothetical protein